MDGSGEERKLQLVEITVPVEVPVRPVSRREVKQLEAALIIGTMFRSDVLQAALTKEEFTTWVDSLAVAAAALAMEKAGYTLSQIAEELGRTEATLRRHLRGETKAGKLVRETYEMLVRGELRIAAPAAVGEVSRRLEEAEKRARELEEELRKLKQENEELKRRLEELKSSVTSTVKSAVESLSRILEQLEGPKA
ncbi:MAG: hypothetical protein ABWW70_03715 [Thermoproteota archaeon]